MWLLVRNTFLFKKKKWYIRSRMCGWYWRSWELSLACNRQSWSATKFWAWTLGSGHGTSWTIVLWDKFRVPLWNPALSCIGNTSRKSSWSRGKSPSPRGNPTHILCWLLNRNPGLIAARWTGAGIWGCSRPSRPFGSWSCRWSTGRNPRSLGEKGPPLCTASLTAAARF